MQDEISNGKEFAFKGKHAEYVIKLTSEIDTRTKFKIFQTNVEILILAPIVGMIYGRKAKVDNSSKADRSIDSNTLNNNKHSLKLNYNKELVTLLINKDSISSDERINKAFRYIYSESEEHKLDREKCESEYLEYILGGVEVLYEKIIENAKTIDDYIDNMYNFIKEVKNRNSEIKMDDEDLLSLCRKANSKQN